MGRPLPTSTDDGAARASARDAWVDTTRHYFVDACTAWRSHPEHALSRTRLVVEGLVHIVCVVLEPTFAPHERGELRRLPMEKAISIAKKYLPLDRRDLVDALKNLGNNFHHNQGVVQRSTPNIALAALLQCSDLLTWLDREVLRTPLPDDYARALAELERALPVATPLPSMAAAVTLAATPLASAVAPLAPRAAPKRRRWLLVAFPLGVLAVLATIGLVVVHDDGAAPAASASPEVAWVKSYGDAIASRNVDQIVAHHAIPSGRFFTTERQSAAQLRGKYEEWFRKEGKGRRVAFRACVLVSAMADGSRAVRCDTHIDPPLDSGRGVIPTCLVFASNGRLISRTEHLSGLAPCPPPPL